MSADVPDDTHAAPAAVPDNDDAADLGDMFGGGEADARPEPTFTEFLHERPSRTALRLVRCESTHSLWGNQLWNAARYFIEKMDDGSIDVAGKCVLEVGSGLGAPSMVAAANGARLVVATDYPDQSVIDLLERNVNANRSAMYSEISQRRGETSQLTCGTEEMLQVQPLLWGSDEHIKRVLSITGGTGYDVLILSDVVFNHVCHDALMRTVSRCLTKGPSSVAYVVFSHHRPLKVQDDLRFFTIAADYGLAVQQTDCRHDFPLMFPDDPGPAEIRQPVWCYTLKHNMDAAGAPCDEVEADVVVLGTGLVESMISAACAKSRLKVLHLEAADFYGGAFATGHRSEFERMVRRLDHRAVFATPALDQLRRVAASRDEPEDVRARAEKEASAIEATLTSRQIALDVCPFVNLADSSLVQQLAESQMGQHLEYQNVSRLAIIDATAFPTQKIFSVPLSRSAAFKSKALGPMDMRRLVALVKDLSGAPDKPEGTEGEDHVPTDPEHDEEAIVRVICRGASPDATLREVLQSNYRISAAVEELLTLGGTLVDAATTPAAAGVELLRVYVASLGKYGGATPFLVSQYGASEVPQLMCRMAAVWEAAFILKRTVAVVEASEALSRQTSEESPEASPRRPAAPKQAVATVKGVYSRSPDGSAVILSNGQRITAKVLIAPKQCAALHLASPQSHPIPSGEAWGHPRVNQIASRVVLVLKAPAVRWSALEPDPVAEDDAPELELRNAVPIPLVIGSLKFRRAPNPNIDASSSSNVSVIVNASFVQLNAASVHAPPGWSVVHLTAPASLVTPTELLEAGVAAFAPNASQDLVFSAAFTLSTDVAALQALRVDADEPLPSPLVVHWKQMATRTEDGGFNVTRVDTNAITVIPITTFSPFGLDDTRYAAEASRAFDAIKTRCGLPNDEPFLAPSPRVAADL